MELSWGGKEGGKKKTKKGRPYVVLPFIYISLLNVQEMLTSSFCILSSFLLDGTFTVSVSIQERSSLAGGIAHMPHE